MSQTGNCSGSNTVDYLVVAGGGAGGAHGGDGSTVGGGGGAGGYRFSNGTASGCYTAGPSPLGASALPVAATGYPISVGGGGTSAFPGNTAPASKGTNTTFSSITSTGGGGGNGSGMCCAAKGNGGSGGGGRAYNSTIPGFPKEQDCSQSDSNDATCWYPTSTSKHQPSSWITTRCFASFTVSAIRF